MKMFFCNGKKDFCGNNNLCLDCDFMDHSGGEYREVPVTNADRIRAMSDQGRRRTSTPKVLTNGKIKIGVYSFTGRKRPALCVEEGNSITVYGCFNSFEGADEFMDKVAELVGCKKEEDDPTTE